QPDSSPIVQSPPESLHPHLRVVIPAARAQRSDCVLPRRWLITQTMTVDAEADRAGETIRAWIPYPREIPGQQSRITLVSSIPAAHQIAPPDTLQRTIHFEQPAVAGEKTRFSVTYDLDISARRFEVDPAQVVPAAITPELAP